MTTPERLLYPMFESLRDVGLPLGIPEFAAAVKAVRADFHRGSPERLCRLLCLIWAKRRDDLSLVASEFREKVMPVLHPAESPKPEKGDESATTSDGASAPVQVYVLEQKAWKVGSDDGQRVPGARLAPPARPLMDRPRFRMTPRPSVGFRDAARAFQRFSRPLCHGLSDEIDVDATIDRICREFYLVRPVFSVRRLNRAGLLLLIDRGGSMTPFSLSIQPVLDAVKRDAGLRQPRIYYFHDCPGRYLFKRAGMAEPVDVDEELEMPSLGLGAMIISDAGAARGDMDGERASRTGRFLDRLRRLTPRMAWINPVPPSRWSASTAGAIARRVPMFPLSREGLEDAVKVMRGIPLHPGVRSDGR